MNNLQVFKYNGNEVRTIQKDGEPWWVLKDVCSVLNLTDTNKTAERLDADELTRIKFVAGGQNREMLCINESGLYNVIIRSDKPEAKPFRKWVTSEVLPSIRKHGLYATERTLDAMLSDPDTMIRVLTELKSEREQRKKLEQENAQLLPDANMARDIMKYTGLYTLKEVADLIESGRTELCTLLRLSKVLSKQTGYNVPLNKYIRLGYFKLKLKEKYNTPVTLVTARGLKFIYRLIKKYDLVDEFDVQALLDTARDMEVA